MRKIINTFITLIFGLLMSFPINVHAAQDKMESIQIHVQLHENGDATIIEKRKAYLTSGTENFIPIENLSRSIIKDFKVTEGNITYEFIEDWDISATREEKAYKNGLIPTSDGYELVWGIGEYGEHEYVLEYTVTDMIKELENAQVLFWKFVNDQTNIPPESVEIEIEAMNPLTEENEKIWAFGFEGEIYFDQEKVIAWSNQPLSQNNYATVLIQFQENTFSTKDFINKTFAEIKDEAFKGSDYGVNTWKEVIYDIFLTLFGLFLIFIFPIIVIIYLVKIIKKVTYKLRRMILFNKIKRTSRAKYYRDLPYEYDIVDLFFLLKKMGLSSHDSIISSYFLRWIHEGTISLETKTKKFLREKEYVELQFHKNNRQRKLLEKRLYGVFYDLSGVKKLLSEKEYIRWSDSQLSKMYKWKKDITKHSQKYLLARGYMEKSKKKYILTEKGKELELKVLRFVNYLKDFSLVHEHDAIQVKLWDEILIWATTLDLTDVVIKQFEKLHPPYHIESSYQNYQTFHTVRYISYQASHKAKEQKSSSTNNWGGGGGGRSSGGGGYTSVGGGGGSFGGGSGGGTR